LLPEPGPDGAPGGGWPGAALLGPLVALTLPVTALVALRSPVAGLAVRVWLIGLGAILCRAVVGPALAAWPRARPLRAGLPGGWRRRALPERLRRLEELERAVQFSVTTAFDLHFRLRPHLVRIATHRLAARGISLETQPQRARALLGPEAWELVRPDRPPPEDRTARGTDLALLRRAVEQLEAV
jgi:hypothetical protein